MLKQALGRNLPGIAALALTLGTALPAAGEGHTAPDAGPAQAGLVKVRGGLIRPPGVYRLELERIEKEKRAREAAPDRQPGKEQDSQRCSAHARLEERNRELHAALRLRPDQESAWADFLAIIQPENPHVIHRRAPGDLTAPERMKLRLEGMEARLTEAQRQLEAIEAFYTLLTPEQRKVFDAGFGPGTKRGEGHDHGSGVRAGSSATARPARPGTWT